MGFIREALGKSVEFVRDEIMPLRDDLMKAGILTPEKQAYEAKSSLVDPWAYNSTNFGYKEKYSLLDYSKCRQITYADPIVASVIQTRLNQVASFCVPQPDKFNSGFKIMLRDKDKEPTDGEKKKMKEIEAFILHCGVPENFDDTPERNRRDSFEMFVRKVIRDSLTFDQLNFEVTPRVNGMPYAFQAVDAATIRRIPDQKEQSEQSGFMGNKGGLAMHNPAAQTISSKHFKEFEPEHPSFVQVINGVVRHQYDEWEMAFGVRNPRTDILSYGYGYSEIEMLVTTITSHMNAETYNRKFFSQGSSIKGVLAFEGSVPPDQLEAFRRQWYAQATGVNNAWRTPIIAMGKDSKLNWQSLHANNREMEFGKWLEYCIKTICGVFQIDPLEIGFDISKSGAGQTGGGGGGLGNSNQQERVRFSQDKGLKPLLVFLQGLINDYIVYRLDPNFEFRFVGLNVGTDKDELDKQIQQIKSFKTINEIRAEQDLEPLPDYEAIKGPGDLVLDPSLIQFITGQLQAKQQEEQAAQGLGPDGQPLGGEMGPDGQPMGGEQPPEAGPDGKPLGPEGEEEPDYANMSVEELQAELDKLDSEEQAPKGKPQAGKGKPQAKPQDLNQAQKKAPPMAKSLMKELKL